MKPEQKQLQCPVPPTPSRAAIKIAEILTGGRYGSRQRYRTTYGAKTVQGIADLIDTETDLPQLLIDCQDLLRQVTDEHGLDHNDGYTEYDNEPNDKCPTCRSLGATQKLLERIRTGE